MLETVNDLIANNKTSVLEPLQMLAQLQYVFTPHNVSVRPGTDEVALRRRDYPEELAPLLPARLSLACPVTNAPEVE